MGREFLQIGKQIINKRYVYSIERKGTDTRLRFAEGKGALIFHGKQATEVWDWACANADLAVEDKYTGED